MIKKETATLLIHTFPDWVNAKRFNYSLQNMIDRYPDGCSNRLIAVALNLPHESRVDKIYAAAIKKIRKRLEKPQVD